MFLLWFHLKPLDGVEWSGVGGVDDVFRRNLNPYQKSSTELKTCLSVRIGSDCRVGLCLFSPAPESFSTEIIMSAVNSSASLVLFWLQEKCCENSWSICV